jgi:hypothetical protein
MFNLLRCLFDLLRQQTVVDVVADSIVRAKILGPIQPVSDGGPNLLVGLASEVVLFFAFRGEGKLLGLGLGLKYPPK